MPAPPPETRAPRPGRGRADQPGMRAANLALVARTIYAAPTPLSRADVAAATEVTRSTASRLVDDLVAAGIVAELTPTKGSGPGRPRTPLVPDGSRYAALGLQLNVGLLAARVVDPTGAIRSEVLATEDLRKSDPPRVLARLAGLAAEAIRAAGHPELVGTGLALPGIVDEGAGMLLRAPNLGWTDVPITALCDLGGITTAARTSRLRIGNEADLAAYATATERPGRPGPLGTFIYLSGEIGIGGAIVIDGQVMRGTHGWAGEIGHVSVDISGPPCTCGSRGCLELYAGRRGLFGAAGLDARAGVAELGAAVEVGDEAARAAVSAAGWALGIALASVINVVDVPAIVLGGHLRELAPLVRDELLDTLSERVLSARWVTPSLTVAAPDAAAGATGAAYRELERLLEDPAGFHADGAATSDPRPIHPPPTPTSSGDADDRPAADLDHLARQRDRR